MYYTAELVLKNYKPLYLEQGMLFFQKLYHGSDKEYKELFELDHDINDSQEEDVFIAVNGYPIELYIVDTEHIKNTLNILATCDEIGWMDEGEDSDELHDITLEEINNILTNDGILEIDVDKNFIPLYREGKVVIRYSQKEQ